ncbi:MAG: DUF4330 family protein [Halorientalis sp.]
MVDVIDEDGRLFGLVNIVDLLVVLVVVAMVAAGWTLLSGAGPTPKPTPKPAANQAQNTSTVVTFEARQVEPYVATAIPNGTVGGPEVVAVRSKSVEPATVVVPDQNGQLHVREHPRLKTVRLELELNTTRTPTGLVYTDERQTGKGPVLRQYPLRIGDHIRFDIGNVTVTGNVTAIGG